MSDEVPRAKFALRPIRVRCSSVLITVRALNCAAQRSLVGSGIHPPPRRLAPGSASVRHSVVASASA